MTATYPAPGVLLMRILMAEDHAELAETVAAGLRREGMAVDIALDGQQALDRAGVTAYDVIVLDRDLPEVHGDEVCRRLPDLRTRCTRPALPPDSAGRSRPAAACGYG
jgi:DNA-binding response OmpR family regulator